MTTALPEAPPTVPAASATPHLPAAAAASGKHAAQASQRSPFTSYFIALASLVGLLGVRLAMHQLGLLENTPYLLVSLPVIFSAFSGGWGPGLVASAGSLLIVAYFLPPNDSLRVNSTEDLITLLTFLPECLLICWLGHRKLMLTTSLEEERLLLESRVADRTAELSTAVTRVNAEVVQRRAAQADLENVNTRLRVSNRELEDFASVASHDLQEPLRKILAFGDRLNSTSGGLGDIPRDYLERMLKAAARMQTLIGDLLTFSRVTIRGQPFTRLDLSIVAAEVVVDLEARIEQQHGRVEIGELGMIDADPTQMRQLLQNLIANGLKFTRPGTPPVVQVTGEADGAGMVRIFVKDNGIGFDEKYLDRIFSVFQRLHARTEYEGTGIGLAVCRKIAERHGGAITARSIPGEGATFIVTLPRTQVQAKEEG